MNLNEKYLKDLSLEGYEFFSKDVVNKKPFIDLIAQITLKNVKLKTDIEGSLKRAFAYIHDSGEIVYSFTKDFKVKEINQVDSGDYIISIQTSPLALVYDFYLKMDSKVPYFAIDQDYCDDYISTFVDALNGKWLSDFGEVIPKIIRYNDFINELKKTEIQLFANVSFFVDTWYDDKNDANLIGYLVYEDKFGDKHDIAMFDLNDLTYAYNEYFLKSSFGLMEGNEESFLKSFGVDDEEYDNIFQKLSLESSVSFDDNYHKEDVSTFYNKMDNRYLDKPDITYYFCNNDGVVEINSMPGFCRIEQTHDSYVIYINREKIKVSKDKIITVEKDIDYVKNDFSYPLMKLFY